MTKTDQPAKSKQHDPEESPRDGARRLVKRWTVARGEDEKRFRVRVERRIRYLSESDRTELLNHLEQQHQLLIERIRDRLDDLPEFGFSSELLDEKWS